MDSLKQLLELLQPMRLYRLQQGSLIHSELSAYGAAIDLLWQRAEKLEKALFIDSCPPERLSQWEMLLGLPVNRAAETARREMIRSKLSITEQDCNLQGMVRSILSAGLQGHIGERPPMGALHIYDAQIIGGYSSLDEVKAQVNAMLPAHLLTEYALGVLTWEMFDAKGLTFDRWDAADFTWEWFDLNGEKLKGEEENAKQP